MQIGGLAGSAMNAFGVEMLVQANNIANINTPEFQAQTATLMSGPWDRGVLVGSIYNDVTPGPPMPGLVSISENGREVTGPGYIEGSNTDIGREFVHMIAAQRGYEANAAMIRTQDDVTGMLLDMKA